MTLYSYLSQDRLRALARAETLPDRTTGSALFADISGFTALTESLRASLGSRQGAEELSKQLGAVFSALIAQVEKYGGSVIGFSGDAILCWFDSHGGRAATGVRAVVCAFGMQSAVRAFPALGLKVAITSGQARRFVVGDPGIQKIDTLAGGTVARTSTAEHLAVKGDVLLDEATFQALGNEVLLKEWRRDEESGERFAVAAGYTGGIAAWEVDPIGPLDEAVLKGWLPGVVFERETAHQEVFLTEFRPCVALFIRFTGIDYDSDAAEGQLDAFIRQVQRIAERYAGLLMDITIGDKGSYAYINLGALSAHEDDARRAIRIALELRSSTDLQLQMGITQGVLRVGAYGGETRKTFGALGDDVNLAARLMTTAAAGEILVSGHVHKVTADVFAFEPRLPLPMKGKAEPLPVFSVTGESRRRAVRLQEPAYALPMVGRQAELQVIGGKLDLAAQGRGQVIGIVAEAGLGKSRLVAEVIRSARRRGFVGFGGTCQSDGIHTPYQAWKTICQAFFEVDPEHALKKQMRLLEGEIEERAPARLEAMPLLNVVLDLDIPENDFTRNLEPRIRQSALHALLEDCLQAAAAEEPLLIVIEDLHWIDALSHDLLDGLAMALARERVCFVLAYRPPSAAGTDRLLDRVSRLEALPQFTRIELHELTGAEAEDVVRAKLAQLYPARGGALPAGLVDVLMARSQGNPFFLEELLNYVRDRGLDPAGLSHIDLPDSLHTLILSRIDQLSEQERTILRVASIVGRLFRASWLMGYYPELGESAQVKAALDALDSLDITPLDSPEPELAYLFKHIVTHEVTYESLPVSTRARLHERLAVYLESAGAPVDAIALHYGRSNNTGKKLEYFQKAADAEQRIYANQDAIRDYRRAIALLQDPQFASPPAAARLNERLGDVLHWTGQYEEARAAFMQAIIMLPPSEWIDRARLQRKVGNGWRDENFYSEALQVYREARNALELVPVQDSAAWWQEWIQVLLELNLVYYWLGQLQESDELALTLEPAIQQHASPAQRASYFQSKFRMAFRRNRCVATPEMVSLSRAALEIHQESGDQAAIPAAQFGLGFTLLWHGDVDQATGPLLEALQLAEGTGDISLQARCLCYLTIASRQCSQIEETRRYAERALDVATLAHMPEYAAMSKANQAWLAWRRDDLALTGKLVEEALALWQQLPSGHASAPLQWLAYFPSIAAALQQGTIPLAIHGARSLLSPTMQPLPDELAGTLEQAVRAWDGNAPGPAGDLLRQSISLAVQLRYL